MKRHALQAAALMALALIGCSRAATSQPAQVDPRTGNVVAFWIVRDLGEEPVKISRSYGALVWWRGGERRFGLYDNLLKMMFVTEDFDEFLREVARMPRGVAIQRVNLCTAGTAYEMPAAEWDRLAQVMKDGGRTWAEGDFMLCYCESKGFRFPKPPRPVKPKWLRPPEQHPLTPH